MKAARQQTTLLSALAGAILLAAGCASVEEPAAAPPTAAAAAQPADPAVPPEAADATPEQENIEYGHFTEDQLTRVILAEMAGQRGYNRQALAEYLELARETGDINIIRRASRIAVFLRDLPAAMEMADMWLAREPDSIEARQTLAFQMLALGRYPDAMRHLSRLLELGEDVDFRVLTSRTASDRNAAIYLDGLLADFESLYARFPEHQTLRLGLAHLYQQTGEPRKAYQHVRELAREMEDAAELDDDAAEVVLLEVQLLELMGEERQAHRRLQESLRDYPEHSQLRFLYARRLIEEEDYREAKRQFSILVEQDPEDYDMLYSLALISMELEEFEEARAYFQRLTASPERGADAHFYLAFINEQEDRLDQAIQHYTQVDSGGNFMEAQRKATELLIGQGRYPEARERLQRLRFANSDYNIPLLAMEASVLMDEEHFQEAETLLDSAVSAFPDDVQLLYLRSVLSQEVDDLALMERDLRKIIELSPENPTAYNTLGYVLADRTNRYQEAYELIQRAIELAPDDPAIIDSLGWVQYRLGMYEEALRNLDRAFELYPDHEVAAHLGEVLWVMGEREEASRVWRDALEETPDSRPIREAMERLTQSKAI